MSKVFKGLAVIVGLAVAACSSDESGECQDQSGCAEGFVCNVARESCEPVVVDRNVGSDDAAVDDADRERSDAGPPDTIAPDMQERVGTDAAAEIEDPTGWVFFHLSTTNANGEQVTSVRQGAQFFLRVEVEDRSPEPLGVYAAYLDVTYSGDLVTAVGPVEASADYSNGLSGDISDPGLIDELGSFATGFDFFGPGKRLVVTVPFSADATGVATFSGNPADNLPLHEVLIHGELEFDPDLVVFGDWQLTITE